MKDKMALAGMHVVQTEELTRAIPNNRELTQPRRRQQQEGHKLAYLIAKNNSFARFARAVFIFDISQTFSFFLRCEMICFAVVWMT